MLKTATTLLKWKAVSDPVSAYYHLDKEKVLLSDLLLEQDSLAQINGLIKEHRYAEALHRYGLPVNNKLLLSGASGCGKTTTAKAIATKLEKPMLVLNLSTIVNAKIGETAQNLQQVFNKAAQLRAVLLLDEFDQIGKARTGDDKDVGEMRRLVNTLLQLIDYYPENALLIAATNHAALIDPALLRRFQLRLKFRMPDKQALDVYYEKLLAAFPAELKDFIRKYDVSYAEAKDYTYTTIKSNLIAALEQQEQ